jgi:putative colanic acid biosysnthesis UDP-glucose lipid carrier transferase
MSVHSIEPSIRAERISSYRRRTVARPAHDDVFHASAKRCCDIVIAAVLVVFTLPLMLVVATLIKLDSRGPVLFRQHRSGRDRKPFVILKFRTMDAQPSSDCRQATRNDRRVTRIGRLLRKSSVDELPQIFNVLRGDMSLVGPRPHPLWLDEAFDELIDGYHERYLVKPGITGLAQTSGLRGETPNRAAMQRRVEKDLEYVEKHSLALDMKILLLTVPSLVWRRDAY